jgi:site-specific recombinase XerD
MNCLQRRTPLNRNCIRSTGGVQALIGATKGSRNESRDRCLLVLMFRQGLRVSEACGLKLDQEPKNIGQAESAVLLTETNDVYRCCH